MRARGLDVAWAHADDVMLLGHDTAAHAQPIRALKYKMLPEVEAPQWTAIDAFDVIVIRKNPPFDASYVRLCWLLMPYEARVVMSNRPALLLTHHEKMIPYQMLHVGALTADEIAPTCLVTTVAQLDVYLEKFSAHHAAWIMKPWMGYGGHDVKKFANVQLLRAALTQESTPTLIQPYLPAIATAGDRRLFFIGGKLVGHLVRIPRGDTHISNLASGGKGELRPLTPALEDRCERIGSYLQDYDIDFAGVDCIGDTITEVNITSPTGLVAYVGLGGPDLVPVLFDQLEKRLG